MQKTNSFLIILIVILFYLGKFEFSVGEELQYYRISSIMEEILKDVWHISHSGLAKFTTHGYRLGELQQMNIQIDHQNIALSHSHT